MLNLIIILLKLMKSVTQEQDNCNEIEKNRIWFQRQLYWSMRDASMYSLVVLSPVAHQKIP